MITRYQHYNLPILIGTLLVSALLFSACNPTRYAYKQVEKRPPLTVMDSLRLNARSLSTWPVKPGVLIEGKAVIDTTKDSTAYYKRLSDQLSHQAPTIIEKIKEQYRDTCTTAVDQYEAGFALGKTIGEMSGRSGCPPSVTRTDTFYKAPPAVEVEMGGVRLENKHLNDLVIQTTTERDISRKSAKKRLYWMIGLITVLVAITGYSIWKFVKKAPVATAGKIIGL